VGCSDLCDRGSRVLMVFANLLRQVSLIRIFLRTWSLFCLVTLFKEQVVTSPPGVFAFTDLRPVEFPEQNQETSTRKTREFPLSLFFLSSEDHSVLRRWREVNRLRRMMNLVIPVIFSLFFFFSFFALFFFFFLFLLFLFIFSSRFAFFCATKHFL